MIEKTSEDFFFLDKDTVYGAYSAHVHGAYYPKPQRPSSPYYLENLRDWEYQGLLDITRENLFLSVNVILVGPFSREIQSGRMFSPEALGMPPQTRITITWIDLEETEAKVRMQKRGDPRDDWKLTH